jgi:hypothetical protein
MSDGSLKEQGRKIHEHLWKPLETRDAVLRSLSLILELAGGSASALLSSDLLLLSLDK